MQETLAQDTINRLALGFLVDHVGIPTKSIARMVRLTPEQADDVIAGRSTTVGSESRRAIDGLAATQSMLLSAYTPTGAATWFKSPCPFLGGRIPAEILVSDDHAAIATVLRAAVERVSH